LIEDYTDHAANERTYLAWVRTALALLAFGLLVERFQLLASALPGSLGAAPAPGARSGASPLAEPAGLGLILLGVLVLAISSYRYVTFKRLIASRETRDFAASRTDLMLVGVVALIGVAMVLYVAARAFLGSGCLG
jgi:putative membrane protein